MMNSVFLSGIVVDEPRLVSQEWQDPHVLFFLAVRRKLKTGEKVDDLHRINAWNGVATFCQTYLKTGMRITLRGHLSLGIVAADRMTFEVSEIVANEIIYGQESGTEACGQGI